MSTIPDAQLNVHGPYEDALIALVGLVGKIIDGQPPDVKAKLWEMFVSDVQAWRSFWAGLKA